MNFDETFNTIFGVTLSGLGSALLVTAIYQMARHATLLFAVVRATQEEEAAKRKYEYSFFVQNVEDVRYPGHLELRVIAGGSCESLTIEDLSVFAGPKQIDFESTVSLRENDYTCAVITFEELPPYDTWLIRCKSKAPSLTLKIVSPDPGSWLKRRLVIDLYPRQIRADASSASRVSVGGSMTPRTFMLAIIAFAGAALYAGTILLMGRLQFPSADFAVLSKVDVLAIVFLLLALWHGFRKIQRPIYPIMQGYLDASVLTQVDKCRPPAK